MLSKPRSRLQWTTASNIQSCLAELRNETSHIQCTIFTWSNKEYVDLQSATRIWSSVRFVHIMCYQVDIKRKTINLRYSVLSERQRIARCFIKKISSKYQLFVANKHQQPTCCQIGYFHWLIERQFDSKWVEQHEISSVTSWEHYMIEIINESFE